MDNRGTDSGVSYFSTLIKEKSNLPNCEVTKRYVEVDGEIISVDDEFASNEVQKLTLENNDKSFISNEKIHENKNFNKNFSLPSTSTQYMENKAYQGGDMNLVKDDMKGVRAALLKKGLSLGGGLIVLASALSDASYESPTRYSFSSTSGSTEDSGLPKYQYGWCLQLSGLALILAEIAALLTVSGYMARFPTVEEMVQVIVPGAARKLREQRGLSSEYLVRAHQKSPGATQARNFDPPTKDVILGPQRLTEEGTSLLCKSAPDICASNPQAISYVDKADLSHMLPAYPDTQNLVDPRFTFVDKADPSIVDSRLSGFADKEGLMDSRILPDSRQNMIAFNDSKEHVISQETRHVTYADNTKSECLLDAPLGFNRYNSMAGQTVPITLKHQNSPTVSAIQAQAMYQNFGTIHSGILRVSEPGTSSSSNSSQRSMTLQNPKRKSQIAQNTFSTLECEKRKPRAAGIAGKVNFYTGSAV